MESIELDAGLAGKKWQARSKERPGQGRLLITVHGIRDYGAWQERFGACVEHELPGTTCLHYHYGYLSIIAFVVTWACMGLIQIFGRARRGSTAD